MGKEFRFNLTGEVREEKRREAKVEVDADGNSDALEVDAQAKAEAGEDEVASSNSSSILAYFNFAAIWMLQSYKRGH